MADSKPRFVQAPAELMNRFIHPFSMAIIGQTMVGKSYLIKEILKYRNQLMTTHFDAIYYCIPTHLYDANQSYLEELRKVCPSIRILENEPSISLIRGNQLPTLFIMDDMMNTVFFKKELEQLFTQASNHYSNSVIFTSQNAFNSKRDQTIVRQLSYRVIFNKNAELRYKREMSLSFSTDPLLIDGCFAMLKKQQNISELNKKFILIDQHPKSPLADYPIRGNIMPGPDGLITPLLFTPRKK